MGQRSSSTAELVRGSKREGKKGGGGRGKGDDAAIRRRCLAIGVQKMRVSRMEPLDARTGVGGGAYLLSPGGRPQQTAGFWENEAAAGKCPRAGSSTLTAEPSKGKNCGAGHGSKSQLALAQPATRAAATLTATPDDE